MCSSPFQIQLAIQSLNKGMVIAYPTESVFGLGCDPDNLSAVERLLKIKRRSAAKGLILIASDIQQLEPWVDFQQVADLQQITDSWPGPETWLVPARNHVSTLLRGEHSTLAVRVSAHPVVQRLCQAFKGAITSTSANKTGQQAARDLFSAQRYFNQQLDYYVPGETSGGEKPTRIRHAVTGQIIRS